MAIQHPDHAAHARRRALSRRGFLGASASAAAVTAADMSQLDLLSQPALAGELRSRQKSVILLWLAGGASQLETWDPKPGQSTGGPFAAIPTSVPGAYISELMPKMAARLSRHTAIIRSLDTKDGGHGSASHLMQMGRRDEPALKYPDLSAMIARELAPADSQVPDAVTFYSTTEGRGSAVGRVGFLGARYAPLELFTSNQPENIELPEGLSLEEHYRRAGLRDELSKRFLAGRSSPAAASHHEAYLRARGLMDCSHLFDIEREPQKVRDRYGPSQFGQQCLIARRLVEAGVPFVKVGRGWWDSHGQNFETHLEMVTELDHVQATLLDDLEERGLLEHVLVASFGEFGRTPRINASLGRDHFARAWSASLSGCGIAPGVFYGTTTDDGQEVKDDKVGAGELFATIFQAVGIPHTHEYHVGSRPIPLVNPGHDPITEVLAHPPRV